MQRMLPCSLLVLSAILAAFAAAPSAEPVSEASALVQEARVRTQMLQEAVQGALQIMHRDFFDPDDRDRIPSASLEDMFEVMKETWGVELHWLGVNAKTMDSDHEPRDQFERAAVRALAAGAEEFEAVEGDSLRHVAAILLHNSCLKCHVPHRTSLEDRVAGLAVRMPLTPRRATSEANP